MRKRIKEGARKHAIPLVKYMILGTFATMVDILALWVLTAFFDIFYLLSGTISFLIGTLVNYFLNVRYTFNKSPHPITFISFMVIGVASLVITLVWMALLVEIFQIHYLIARILAAIITLSWNYGMNHKFTFRK